MIKSNFYSTIWSLTLVLHRELTNHLGFPGYLGIFCSNQVTFGGLPYSSLIDSWLERPSHDEKLGTLSPTSYPLGKKEGLEINNQSYLPDKAAIKNS